MRRIWLEIIGIENINPRRKMWYVCSEHMNKRMSGVRLCDYMSLTVGILLFNVSCTML